MFGKNLTFLNNKEHVHNGCVPFFFISVRLIKIFRLDFSFIPLSSLFLIKLVFLNILAYKIVGLKTFSLNL